MPASHTADRITGNRGTRLTPHSSHEPQNCNRIIPYGCGPVNRGCVSFSEVLGHSLACALAQGSAVCCCFLCVTLDIVVGGPPGLSPSPAFLLGTDPSGELRSPHLHWCFLLGAELGEPSMPLHVRGRFWKHAALLAFVRVSWSFGLALRHLR